MGSSSPLTLRRLCLKPEDCAATELFVRWRDALGEVFEVRATPSEISGFRGEIDIHASPHYVLSATRHSPLSLIRRCASAAQERFAISLWINGATTGLAGDGAMQVEPGDVLFIDLTQTLAMRQSAPQGFVEGVTLWTARDRILPFVSDENALHGLVLKAESPAGAVIGATLRAFAKTAPKMRLTDFDALADGLVALAAKSAAPALAQDRAAAASPRLATFVTIRRHIDRNLASPDLGADFDRGRVLPVPGHALSPVRTGRRHRQIYSQGPAEPGLSRNHGSRTLQPPDRPYRLYARLQERERLQPPLSGSLWRQSRRSAQTSAPDGRQARIRGARATGRVADALARRSH